jgi:S1-C subfamily serine protease
MSGGVKVTASCLLLVGVLSHRNNESEGCFMLRYVILALTLMVGMAPWQAFAQDEASLRGGVVKIMSTNRDGMHSTGTGFVVKAEGSSVYIVTAAHVVEGDSNPQVEFFTRRNTPVSAAVLKKDLRYDLALLKAESPQPPMVLRLETSAMPSSLLKNPL